MRRRRSRSRSRSRRRSRSRSRSRSRRRSRSRSMSRSRRRSMIRSRSRSPEPERKMSEMGGSDNPVTTGSIGSVRCLRCCIKTIFKFTRNSLKLEHAITLLKSQYRTYNFLSTVTQQNCSA